MSLNSSFKYLLKNQFLHAKLGLGFNTGGLWNSCNSHNLPSSPANRQYNPECKDIRLFGNSDVDSEQCLLFFRDKLSKESSKEEKRQQNIREHCEVVYNQFLSRVAQFSSDTGSNFTWKAFLRSFPLQKEFLQHIFTVHDDLYSSIIRAIESNKDSIQNVNKEVTEKLRALETGILIKTETFDGVSFQCLPLYGWYKKFELGRQLKKFVSPKFN